jgi:tripartite-type tricarboxylate transporter receptor subunit TctC
MSIAHHTRLLGRHLVHVVCAAAMLAFAPLAVAQAYPSKPVRLVIPFAAGSATDTVGRVFGQKLGEILGQPFVVENKPGANGTIAASDVARAAPDGYTLLVGTNTTNAVIRMMMKNVPYDPERDFTPISFLGVLPQVVTVSNNVPAKTLAELITYARSNPGKVTYAWSNSAQRVSAEMLASMAGIQLYNVPYKLSPQAMTDLISGEVQLYITDMIVALPQIQGGKARALAVTTSTRAGVLPDVPTVAEAGPLPGFEVIGIFALYGPAGMPADLVSKLNDAVRKAGQDADLRKRLGALGLEIQPSTPEELAARMRREMQNWTKVAAQAGIEPQ